MSINSYYFVDELCRRLPDDATVVLDMATAFTCVYQAAKMKYWQRWITAPGIAPMGYGLPGAIGAAFATGGHVICIVGDGALQFSVQEFQTIVHHKLPITVFVLNNGGYLTIKLMQDSHFKRRVGSDDASGISCPRTRHIANAYGIHSYSVASVGELEHYFNSRRETDAPCVVEIMMDSGQPLIPRIASHRAPDGSIRSSPLEDMSPLLPRDEFASNMLVKQWEGS